MEPSESPDLEVAQVLASGFTLTNQPIATTKPGNQHRSGTRSQPSMTNRGGGVLSDKLEMRPATVMTNFTRGNTSTTAHIIAPLGMHKLAAQGEMLALEEQLNSHHVDEQDENGFTALMWAVYYNQIETVQYLITQNANCDMKGNKGENIISIASTVGNDEILKYLLDTQQCDLNEIDTSGNTALLYAVYGGHVKCVELLLNRGADLSHRNKQKHCAFDIAVNAQKPKVQKVIEKHMVMLLSGAM